MNDSLGLLFHLPTAYLTVGTLYVLFSFAAWLALKVQGNRTPDIWCAGGVLLGLGFILLGLRSQLVPWLAYPVPNALLTAGNLLHIAALRKELEKPLGLAVLAGLFLLVMIPFEVFRQWMQAPGLRFVWIGSAMTVMVAWTTALGWMLSRIEDSKSARWLALSYGVLTIAVGMRFLSYLVGIGEPDALAATAAGSAMLLSAMAAAALGNAAIMGLYLERSSRKNLAYAVAEDRQRIAARLRDKITDLDRQRVLIELASSLAHELGQPLTGILVDSGAIRGQTKSLKVDDPQIGRTLDSLEQHALRAREMIRGIRGLSGPGEDALALVDVRSVIHDVILLIDEAVRENRVRFETLMDGTATRVLAHQVLLSLVFINVFRNAIEANTADRPVLITVELRPTDTDLHIEISDDGPGFSDVAAAQACEPFFTTKSGGLGVGLALSQRIITQHEGKLSIRNRQGARGAIVELVLPLAQTSSHGALSAKSSTV